MKLSKLNSQIDKNKTFNQKLEDELREIDGKVDDLENNKVVNPFAKISKKASYVTAG